MSLSKWYTYTVERQGKRRINYSYKRKTQFCLKFHGRSYMQPTTVYFNCLFNSINKYNSYSLGLSRTWLNIFLKAFSNRICWHVQLGIGFHEKESTYTHFKNRWQIWHFNLFNLWYKSLTLVHVYLLITSISHKQLYQCFNLHWQN